MKRYNISRWTFIIISILILALPVSRRWRLILNGEKTTGVVTEFGPAAVEQPSGTITIEEVSQIRFPAGDTTYLATGPSNYRYKKGRTVGVLYDPADPGHNCILTFTAFYLSDYSALPLILLIFWAAFYLSFNTYTKYARKHDQSKDLADSPYRPFRKDRKKGEEETGQDQKEIAGPGGPRDTPE